MNENKNKIDIFTALRPKLREYLISKGVVIDDSGFLSCIHPNHPDKHPSCSIGGNTNEEVFHCFSCLPMTEKVRTPSGLKMIKDLKIDDVVYSQYGTGKIVNTISRTPVESIIEVQLQNVRNDNIKFTANHIFKIVKDMVKKVPYIKSRKDGNYDVRFFGQLKKRTRSKKYSDKIDITECRTDELQINDYVVFPKTKKNISAFLTGIENIWIKEYTSGPKNGRINTYPINEDTMWLLGLYCAEGSSYRGGITFTLHRNEKEFQDKIKFIIKNNFNLDCSIYEYDYKSNTTNISCSSTDLQHFFEGFVGKYSSYKYISDEFICGLDTNLQKAWLNGLFDGDGSKRKPKKLTLVNENLISTAQQIMVNLEIPFSYSYKESYWGNDGIERKPTWSLTWLAKENIGCFYDTASDGFRYAFLRIDKLYTLESKPEVVDITVEELDTNSHTFMTKHYLVHNCGCAGNIMHAVHFLEKKPITGLGLFTETLPYLAKMFDIPYEPIEISEDQKREFQKRRAYEDAANVIHSLIYKKQDKMRVVDAEHPAIKHLLERGISLETIKRFRIGCIPSHKEYMDEMKVLGWTDKSYLESADLANRKIFSPTGIIIPIYDDKSRAVGFVTRRTDMEANAHGEEKYVNSQNSDIYHKSEILFNYNNCRPEDGPLYIVEGYLDAVYLVQSGISNVAAIGATMLTEEHVDMLFRDKFRNIVICLDADDGGRRGVKLAIERLSGYKTFKVRIMELLDKYDPDTYVREFGKDKFIEQSRSDMSLSPFTWMLKWTTFEDDPMETAKKAIPTIAAEESNIVRLQMIRELSRLTGLTEMDIRKDVDALVNRESSRFLEELSEINNYIQVQLSRKKTRDTKGILEEGLLKVKNLEGQFNSAIDNKSEYIEKLEDVKMRIASGEFKYGLRAAKFRKFYENFDGIPYTTCLTLIGGRPSAGKSFSAGTPILMYDGSIKPIEEIKVGELLMGPDSKPRTVLTLGSGVENMYDIIPDRGMTWNCNEPHILSLRMSSNNGKIYKKGQIFNLTIKEYLAKNKKFKHHAKLYRTGWSLPEQIVPYDPYWIGSWIGDGDYLIPQITTADLEYVEDYYNNFANKNGFSVTKRLQEKNTYRLYFRCNTKIHPLNDYLKKNCKIQKEKRIPKEYLLNSESNRLELLAGLIDTDGSLCRKNSHTYEIATKYEGLKDDILYLGNSLGFLTTFKIKKVKINGKVLSYFRIHISGDIYRVPVKIPRKKATSNTSRTNHLNIGFKIVPTGKGQYYGVTLNNDHLFLLGDGTVTHNTMWLTELAMDVIDTEEDAAIFYMSIDDTTELMTLKMLAMKSGLSTSEIKRYSELSPDKKQQVDLAWAWVEANSDRFILADATAGNSIDALEAHVDWFTKNFKTPKRLFLLDNFHKLRFNAGGRAKKTEVVSDGSERIKEITQLNDLHLLATVELRKLENSNSRPQLNDMKDSVQLEYDADIIALVHNDKQVKEDTYLVWEGPAKDGNIRAMPYIEVNVWKNKITGQLRPIAYRLNDYNLRLEEINDAELRALKDKKTNGQNQMGKPREI